MVLAEDHARVAEQLRHLLAPEFDVVVTVVDGHWLVRVAESERPDVIVTDIVMPGLDGIAATALLERYPGTRIVLVIVHDEPELAACGHAAGALGYVGKHRAGQELVAAVRVAVRGERYVSPNLRNPGG